ncbi:MAG: prepilin-type N-terminal cleavage/methylation domain-containing protein [Mollicutes bacterium]|nr:prepilin-type N-terminal cleavage/methylation domain-containing protein [Mollicutes bacterium]
MKDKRGFTMVELIAVVIILGALMIIVYPSVNRILTGGRKTVDDLTKKNLEDASTIFAQDIYICEDSTIINILKNDVHLNVTNCNDAKEALQSGITFSMDILKQYEYIAKADKCSGNIIIRMNGTKMTNISADVSNVTCN